MVKVREDYPLDFEGKLDAKKWLDRITNNRNTKEIELINKAIKYAEKISNGLLTKYGEPCFEQSLIMAEILHSLGMDSNTIAASIIYGPFPYIDFPEKNLAEMFNDEVAKLILTLAKVDEAYKKAESRIEHSTIEKSDFLSKTMDNLRNMFLGLSQDIRAILIKLSQHLSNLRFAKNISKDNRRKLAIEAKKVFAPVANRLGIGQLKWEIEDLAFRYLDYI